MTASLPITHAGFIFMKLGRKNTVLHRVVFPFLFVCCFHCRLFSLHFLTVVFFSGELAHMHANLKTLLTHTFRPTSRTQKIKYSINVSHYSQQKKMMREKMFLNPFVQELKWFKSVFLVLFFFHFGLILFLNTFSSCCIPPGHLNDSEMMK